MFSPWRFNIDRASRALLEARGWTEPDLEAFPTGRELVERYLEPLAATPEMAGRIRMGTRVTAVARAGLGKVRTAGREAAPFELRLELPGGEESVLLAGAVIDASGTWLNPARRAPRACPPPASARPPTGSATGCRTCSAPSAAATPGAA